MLPKINRVRDPVMVEVAEEKWFAGLIAGATDAQKRDVPSVRGADDLVLVGVAPSPTVRAKREFRAVRHIRWIVFAIQLCTLRAYGRFLGPARCP